MAQQDNSLQPIQILIDELGNEDLQSRLNSIRNLSTIAQALGTDRTREELIPFLSEFLDDEDEVLFVIAEELGNFSDYVGGNEYAYSLLPLLEILSSVEESTVREKANASLIQLASLMPVEHIAEHIYPITKRLAEGDWFTSKMSSIPFLKVVYPHADDNIKTEIRQLYKNLIDDKSPSVRKISSQHLGEFLKVVELEYITEEMYPMFIKTSTDEQDSVRLLSVETSIALAGRINPEEIDQLILPTIKNICVDKSWRVRYMASQLFCEVCQALGTETTKNEMLEHYIALLRDNEAEVRSSAAGKVTNFCKLIPSEVILDSILPCINDLVEDKSEYVRASLAADVMGLAPFLGKENTLNHLLDIFLHLLKDDSSDVRLGIISKLEAVNEVVGIDLLSQNLLPAIKDLAEDRQWRVRLAIIEYIPLLSSQLGVEFFDDKLSGLCMCWLGDPVCSIREAATKNLKKLIEVFGLEWAQNNIIPKVLNRHSHSNYLYRMTTLCAIGHLSEVVTKEIIVETMLPLVVKMASDPVPNIRFNVAKILNTVSKYVDPEVTEKDIIPTLQQLLEDKDKDVQYFANESIQIITNAQ
eukprot:TRINITY_DN9023_c0_g1_i1.p1 TRINITY_DN9023_c0_g1~~TRINITY_DN9023_c0_g1_i1.p1  ORF type:complete len:585 (+),score=188.29 TRINITY_DN9023_c0_g1_i1:120-1874(+)